jgi:hypothetical protein
MENKNKIRKILSESVNTKFDNILYSEGITERIHPTIVNQLYDNSHSLSNCKIFPKTEVPYEIFLIKERFSEVVKKCREAFDCDEVNGSQIILEQMPLVKTAMSLESEHKDKLIELAIKMVMEEFDIPESVIEVDAQLVSEPIIDTNDDEDVSLVGEDFYDTNEIEAVDLETQKRRVLNAMTQGASKRVNHMFHMVSDELREINPRLLPTYKKMMSAADYMYYIIPQIDKGVNGGVCNVNTEGETPRIEVKAMVFPVLIHEIVKGVMEILSLSGLPQNKRISEYVLKNADKVEYEPWDMIIGPALWGRFCDMIPTDDFKYKHYVYHNISQLPVDEFFKTIKEIISKTKRGEEIINEILTLIKKELKNDELNDDLFSYDELI